MHNPPASNHVDPRDDYSRRLQLRRASLTEAIRRHVIFGNLRGTLLVAGVVGLYAAFMGHWFSAWWLLVPAVAFFWTGARLDAALLLHPTYPLSAPSLNVHALIPVIGFLFDTTTATMRLILDGPTGVG